jgi:hypothetical protein
LQQRQADWRTDEQRDGGCGGRQAWATLEERQGNLVRARKLFDAATAADRTHAAAWHGWGMLEKAAGNPERARGLFLRGLRYQKLGQPNEYLYQSIAVLAMEVLPL